MGEILNKAINTFVHWRYGVYNNPSGFGSEDYVRSFKIVNVFTNFLLHCAKINEQFVPLPNKYFNGYDEVCLTTSQEGFFFVSCYYSVKIRIQIYLDGREITYYIILCALCNPYLSGFYG